MTIYELARNNTIHYNGTMASKLKWLDDLRKKNIRESLMPFEHLEHRLEFVATIGGVDYINDSKATVINATWYALEMMERPVLWIAGGQDKGSDYTELHEVVKEKVKGIICLGRDNDKIIKAFQNLVPIIAQTITADDAVKAAYRAAKKGDVVVLSPANASFDLFKNYEDRGRQFKAAVRAL